MSVGDLVDVVETLNRPFKNTVRIFLSAEKYWFGPIEPESDALAEQVLGIVFGEQVGDWGIASQNDGLKFRVRIICGKGELGPSLPALSISFALLAVIVDEVEDTDERREKILMRRWEGPVAPGAEADTGIAAIVVAVVTVGGGHDINQALSWSWPARRDNTFSDRRLDIWCLLEPNRLPSSVSTFRDECADDTSAAEFSR